VISGTWSNGDFGSLSQCRSQACDRAESTHRARLERKGNDNEITRSQKIFAIVAIWTLMLCSISILPVANAKGAGHEGWSQGLHQRL